jgi:hypothetical protein
MEALLLLLFGLGGLALAGGFGPPAPESSSWAGVRAPTPVRPVPCPVRFPLLGAALAPELMRWTTPDGWTMAWLREPGHLAMWSEAMGHDLTAFMAGRSATEFAFGIVDPERRPRASFVLAWVESPRGAHWEVNFAQGAGEAALDAETLVQMLAFGREMGLDCKP